MISVRRKYMSREDERKLLMASAEIDRMLSGLISSLEEKMAAEELAEDS